MAASAQPPSAFALVESALRPLSGDGCILTKCLEYFGDTPTILMTLMDGEAGDDGENDGEDGATSTGTAGPIWSHVVSFMDAFTLASLDMTCRDAYRADKWKTADRWVEWDEALFEHAKGTCTTRASKACQSMYTLVHRWSQRHIPDWYQIPLPDTFERERDGQSRRRVLECAVRDLEDFYDMDHYPRKRLRTDAKHFSRACSCAMRTVLGSVCGWRRIPVRIEDITPDPDGRSRPDPLVSNLR